MSLELADATGAPVLNTKAIGIQFAERTPFEKAFVCNQGSPGRTHDGVQTEEGLIREACQRKHRLRHTPAVTLDGQPVDGVAIVGRQSRRNKGPQCLRLGLHQQHRRDCVGRGCLDQLDE